jgi:hypothetical protein
VSRSLSPSFKLLLIAGLATLAGCGGTTEPKPVPASISARSSTVSGGIAGEALSSKPSVKVADAAGTAIEGLTVNFAVTSGGGSLSATTGVTDAEGIATSGTWTLGTVAGMNTVTASVAGLAQTQTFTATGNAGAPASLTVNGGNNQNATAGTAVPVPPSVRVTDVHGNLVTGHSVTFVVTGGGGSVTQGTVTTNGQGIATLGSWTLGAAPGVNSLMASATLTLSVPFTATGQDGPTVIEALSGDRQALSAGASLTTLPTVRVRNALGQGVGGVSVTFAVGVGGGSITGTSAITNSNGDATLGSWTLGTVGGLNTVVATAAAISGAGRQTTISASGCFGGGAGYKLTLCILTEMTQPQRDAFTLAAARWAEVITGELADVPFASGLGVNGCSTGTFSLAPGTSVDDLLIFAQIQPIDGPGAVLGSAGPCRVRTSGGLSVAGAMRFDVADVDNLISQGRFNSVILHEMGHVIGIGTLWGSFLVNPSSAGNILDTHFTGVNGIAGFDAIGGTTYTGGQKVPVENTGGPGTVNGHWREGVLLNELMTGFISGTSQPMSLVTVKALQDLGYIVDESKADPFALTLSVMDAPKNVRAPLMMFNDIDTGPVYAVDALGRIVRRIR